MDKPEETLLQQVKEDKDLIKMENKWPKIKTFNKTTEMAKWKVLMDKQETKEANRNNKSKVLKMMNKKMKINDSILT
jgi:hypothetical protein